MRKEYHYLFILKIYRDVVWLWLDFRLLGRMPPNLTVAVPYRVYLLSIIGFFPCLQECCQNTSALNGRSPNSACMKVLSMLSPLATRRILLWFWEWMEGKWSFYFFWFKWTLLNQFGKIYLFSLRHPASACIYTLSRRLWCFTCLSHWIYPYSSFCEVKYSG